VGVPDKPAAPEPQGPRPSLIPYDMQEEVRNPSLVLHSNDHRRIIPDAKVQLVIKVHRIEGWENLEYVCLSNIFFVVFLPANREREQTLWHPRPDGVIANRMSPYWRCRAPHKGPEALGGLSWRHVQSFCNIAIIIH